MGKGTKTRTLTMDQKGKASGSMNKSESIHKA